MILKYLRLRLSGSVVLERFQAKWKPVRIKKTRQIRSLESRFESIETEKALGSRRASKAITLMISMMQGVLGLASGALVGFSLGLVGGGGSILAVPLMVYVVGVPDAHVAIGTSAIAVAANAAVNLSNHARGRTLMSSCPLTSSPAGIAGP